MPSKLVVQNIHFSFLGSQQTESKCWLRLCDSCCVCEKKQLKAFNKIKLMLTSAVCFALFCILPVEKALFGQKRSKK